MKLTFASSLAFGAALVVGQTSLFAQDDSSTSTKPSIGVSGSRTTARSSRSRKTSQAQSSVVGAFSSGELVAQGFTVNGNSCMDFDSVQDLTGADHVTISIFALNANISATQIIPLFGVPNSPYLGPGADLIDGRNFVYSDGGGATVSVGGSDLSIRVCNSSRTAIRYDQLTAYATGAQFAGNHF